MERQFVSYKENFRYIKNLLIRGDFKAYVIVSTLLLTQAPLFIKTNFVNCVLF